MLRPTPGVKNEPRVARLDGIRALAIVLVFATHAQVLQLGWVGVQLFFVLSGLFITGILRRSREDASYWPPFYIRRATRILPPLVIAFAGAALFWPIFFLTPFQLDGLAAGSLLALLFEDAYAAAQVKRWSGWLFGVCVVMFAALSFAPAFHREVNSMLFNSLGYTLINLGSCGLVAFVFCHENSAISRVLGTPTAAFIGAISYGMYLIHPIVLQLVDHTGIALHWRHNRTLAPLTFLVVVGLSWLSFRYYEQPLIAWGRGKARALQATRESTAV